MKKNICILGSTGSIGKSTLEVIKDNPDYFNVVALAAFSNIDLLEEQIKIYKPEIVCVYDEKKAQLLKKRISHVKIVTKNEGLIEIVTLDKVDFVMSAIMRFQGIIPTVHAILAKKQIGFANKETLVCAGEYINNICKLNNVDLIPVDSEHNAIFQCLKNENIADVKRIILTSSGGPFFNFPKEKLKNVTLQQALCHPNFKMGNKITINSSTMMNKAFEIIEAYYLFNLPIDKIDVVVHPQQLIHGLVEYKDGNILAQMASADMKIPINYALFYPKRNNNNYNLFDFTKYSSLTFYPANDERFIALKLAKEALKKKKSMPCYLNAVNEVLVEKFLNGQIKWIKILEILEKLISLHREQDMLDLDSIIKIDALGREDAKMLV